MDDSQGRYLARLAERPVSRTSVLPLYWQAAQAIKEALRAVPLEPGVPLPSEKYLAHAVGVSRPTLRQAMSTLASEGVVHSRRGVGTFAMPGNLQRSLGTPSLFRDLVAQGRRPSSQVLVNAREVPPPHVAEQLALDGRQDAVHIERLRLADGAPMALMDNYLVLPIGRALADSDLETQSMYELLLNDLGLEVITANQRMMARTASDRERSLLSLPIGSPVLVSQRTGFDGDGRAIEFSNTVFVPDTEVQTGRP